MNQLAAAMDDVRVRVRVSACSVHRREVVGRREGLPKGAARRHGRGRRVEGACGEDRL